MVAQRWGFELEGFSRMDSYKPRFSFILGDIIYADVPFLWVGLGSNVDNYYAKYRETYVDPHFTSFVQNNPMFTTYDDHEIINDFRGSMHKVFNMRLYL